MTASMAGCGEGMYGVPVDSTVDQPADSSDSRDQAQEEISDVVSEDAAQSEDPAQEDSGPAPMYGPVVDT